MKLLSVLLTGAALSLGLARADYSGTVVEQQPLAYYRLNETAQPPADLAVNQGSLGTAANGTYQGTVSHPIVPGALASGTDGAMNVNGGGVYVPADSGINAGGAFTAEFWARPAVANTGSTLTCPFASLKIDGSGRLGWLFYQAAGGWNFRVGDETGYTGNITGGQVAPGAWQHVVGTFSSDGTVILYVNGVEVGRQTGKNVSPNPDVALGIGIRGDASFAFNGDVDEAAFYPAALSAAQVLAHYQAGTNAAPTTPYDTLVKSSNPLGYWRLGEADPTVFAASAVGDPAVRRGRYVAGGLTTGVPSLRPAAYAGFESGNTGLQFDGSGGSVRLPAPGATLDRFTVTAWVNPSTAPASFAGIVFARASNLPATGFGFTEGGQLGYHWNDAAESYNYRSGLVPAEGSWSFVAMVVEPSQAVFYLRDANGLQVATNLTTHTPLALAAEFVLAQDPGNTARRFVGEMDEVALFSRALTAGEILSQYYAAVGNVAPEILVPPSVPSRTIYAGEEFGLGVIAAGTPPLTYEWRKGGTVVGTGSSLLWTALTVADSGSYTVTVRNGAGSVTSDPVTLTVTPLSAPVITTPPVSVTRLAGGSARFSVVAEGSPPLAYQWRKGTEPVPGGTNSTLVLSSLTVADAGAYSVVVSNPAGNTPSAAAQLTVTTPTPGTYTAVVMADGPVAFYRLGETTGEVAVDVAGGFDAAYSGGLTQGQPGAIKDDPSLSVNFDGTNGKVELPFTPEVNPTQFTIEVWARVAGGEGSYRSPLTSRDDLPQRGYIFYATPGNVWEFWTGRGNSSGWDVVGGPAVAVGEWTHLVATYDGTIKRFYVNGTEVGTSTGAFGINAAKPLRIGAGATDSVDGNFFFNGDVDEVAIYARALSPERISLHYGTGLGAGIAPTFSRQPVSRAVLPGANVTFTVAASGSLPLSYQWRKGTQDIAGATQPTLTLSEVTPDAAGEYRCVVRNLAGTVTSDVAVLSVVTVPSGPYQDLVLADNPVGYWRLDETSGEVAVDAKGENPGTYLNGVTLGEPGAFTTGGNRAIRLTAANQTKVEVPFSTALNGVPFSIEAWAKVTGGAGNYRSPVSSRGDQPQRGYIFYATPDNTWQFWTGTGEQSGWNIISGPAVTVDAWTHLVATYDGTTKVFYVNGVEAGRDSSAFGPNDEFVLRIGGGATENPVGDFFFEGLVDEVAVYGTALSPERVLVHYAAGTGAGTAPTLGIARAATGAAIVLTWTGGTLEESAAVTGGWTAVTGTSPLTVQTGAEGAKFYRVRR